MGLFSSIFGGQDSTSTTTTSTTTTNTDRRQVTDGGSVGVTADNSDVNVNTTVTDLGAIQGAFDLATSSSKAASATILGALGIVSDSLTFQQSQFQQAAERAADALADDGGIFANVTTEQWAAAGLLLFGLVLVSKKGS